MRGYRLDVQDKEDQGKDRAEDKHKKKKPGHLLLWANGFRQIRKRVKGGGICTNKHREKRHRRS